MTRMIRPFCAALIAMALPTALAANPFQDRWDNAVARNLEGALAILGVSAVPSETASTLFLDTGSNSENTETFDFQASQFGGGFRIAENIPLYLEGYLGWSRYDPYIFFDGPEGPDRLPLKWTSVAATGGIGYEIDLSDHWVLRPMAHITLGRIQTDLSVGAQVIAERIGLDVQALLNGGVTAGGYGASVALEYNRRWDSDWEADLSLRHTHIRLLPIAGDKDLIGEADSVTTTLWTRLRQPTGYELFDRPIRIVYEASGSLLPGDQGEILETDWLAQLGFGGEIDLEETWVPWVTTTRLVARYTRGEKLEGFSVGLACSF